MIAFTTKTTSALAYDYTELTATRPRIDPVIDLVCALRRQMSVFHPNLPSAFDPIADIAAEPLASGCGPLALSPRVVGDRV